MPSVVYTAQREIISGRAAGTGYSLNFSARVYEPAASVRREVHRSIGGQQETVSQSYDRVWLVQPAPIIAANLQFWYEFLHSVQYGEEFTFDYLDASPLAGIAVILENGDDWQFSRLEFSSYYQLGTLRFRDESD